MRLGGAPFSGLAFFSSSYPTFLASFCFIAIYSFIIWKSSVSVSIRLVSWSIWLTYLVNRSTFWSKYAMICSWLASAIWSLSYVVAAVSNDSGSTIINLFYYYTLEYKSCLAVIGAFICTFPTKFGNVYWDPVSDFLRGCV